MSALRRPVATPSPASGRNVPVFALLPARSPAVAERLPEGSHGLQSMEPGQPTPPRRVATPEPPMASNLLGPI